MAPATGRNKIPAGFRTNRGKQPVKAPSRIAAHSRRQLPAPQHRDIEFGHKDRAEDFMEISGPSFAGMRAYFFRLGTVIRANECGKTGVKGPRRSTNRVRDLRIDLFGNSQPANVRNQVQSIQRPFKSDMHRHGRDEPQIIGRWNTADAQDGILHLSRNSQVPGNFVDLCLVPFNYRKERIRESAFEPFGRKPAEPAGAEDPYSPWRENIREYVRW
jgi:hypothetical protein